MEFAKLRVPFLVGYAKRIIVYWGRSWDPYGNYHIKLNTLSSGKSP